MRGFEVIEGGLGRGGGGGGVGGPSEATTPDVESKQIRPVFKKK